MSVRRESVSAIRARHRDSIVADLREGRKQRASIIPARKGAGSYRRERRDWRSESE